MRGHEVVRRQFPVRADPFPKNSPDVSPAQLFLDETSEAIVLYMSLNVKNGVGEFP
jgi:hypothetical protein